MVAFFSHISTLYNQHKKHVPVISFFVGFTWDSLTLNRIDQLFNNLILLIYIALLGSLIILVNFVHHNRFEKPIFRKYRDWYPISFQFLLGGLFNSYVVFYSQSASLGHSQESQD